MGLSLEQARAVGDSIGINWGVIPQDRWQQALAVQWQRSGGDLTAAGKIAMDNMLSNSKFYSFATRRFRVALALLAVAVVVIIALLWRATSRREGLASIQDSPGHWTPMPGDPDRNILRRSQPYPPGLYGGMENGIGGYYFQFDPNYSSSFEHDACYNNPSCKGFDLANFTTRNCSPLPSAPL